MLQQVGGCCATSCILAESVAHMMIWHPKAEAGARQTLFVACIDEMPFEFVDFFFKY